jgi:hypothetical protein
MPDYTQDYIARGIGGITNALKDAMDPRTQIALQAARRDAELHPLRQQKYQSDIDLSGARALTEGERMELYKAQAGDQTMRTRFRGMLGGEAVPQYLPDVSPLIDNATANFKAAAQSYPGAAAHLGLNLAAPTPAPGAMAADGYQQPNDLLPPLNGPAPFPSNYNYQELARIAAATADNPNAPDLIEALARAQALGGSGPMTEDQARRIALAQGLLPNVNTAVTPQTQTDILSAKYANAMALGDAKNQTTLAVGDARNKTTIAAAMMKGANGGNVNFSEGQKMQEAAQQTVDQLYGIERDEAGNVTNRDQAIVAQAEALTRRTRQYIQYQQMDPIGARAQAQKDLFGSADRGNPAYYNQPSTSMLPSLLGGRDQYFSAKNVNQDATGDVDRTGSADLNGPSTSRDAMFGEKLGVAGQQQPAVLPPMLPGLARNPTNEFALRPSNKEVEQRKKDQSEMADLQAQVAQIETSVRAGKVKPGLMEFQWSDEPMPNQTIDLNSNPDARNKLIVKRKNLLDKINALQSKIGIAPSMGDIQSLYAP